MSEGFNILLVDDDPEIRGALRRSLQLPSYRILEANDGIEAMELFREHEFDAVVTDFEMPRMNGLELLKWVRLSRPDVPRILITGRADVHLAVQAINEGAVTRFFLKPWDNVDLRGILRTVLHGMRTPQVQSDAT